MPTTTKAKTTSKITAINATPINEDLLREREAATFSVDDFAVWWGGGREELNARRALEQLFFEDDEFVDRKHISYMSHKELFEYTTVKATKFLKKLRALHSQKEAQKHHVADSEGVEEGTTKTRDDLPSMQSMYNFRILLSGPLGTALFQQSFPLRLHFTMFLPTLLGQATEEQQREWVSKAWQLDGVIGTYAQTELGHGTFIRGLETRADYDAERQEFVLNTPTLTAYKWWPGGLGQTANVVVIMAQLYIKGRNCGLHPFIVRIRNEKTHQPEEGVDVGEIGTKLGFNGVNNGFLGLRNVRIPRMQMLMKNAQVLPDGTFVKGPTPLLTYGTMVFVRVTIVRDVAFNLLLAATIATRYSAVRRQSPIAPDQPEPQILDHLTQQAKVLPQIAKGIVFRLAADLVWEMYQTVLNELNAGNHKNLPELHALSCCLKSICSHDAAEGIEILRKACGGHGFLSSANFAQIYGTATAACTYEGENTVLLLQTARFLMKNYMEGFQRKVLPKTVAYLRLQNSPVKWNNETLTLVLMLERTAAEKTRIAYEYQRLQTQSAQSAHVGANFAGLKLIQAAELHGRAFLTRTAFEYIKNLKQDLNAALREVLQQLLDLFVMDSFLHCLGDVLRFNSISAVQLARIEQRYERNLAKIRKNAVAIVDGFDFHDRVLNSALGCYDGRVYERLMEEARKSPLNQEQVNETFLTHLKPLMQSSL